LQVGEDAKRLVFLALTLRIFWMTATLRSCVLWEKFRRTTSTPARIKARMTASVFEAGQA